MNQKVKKRPFEVGLFVFLLFFALVMIAVFVSFIWSLPSRIRSLPSKWAAFTGQLAENLGESVEFLRGQEIETIILWFIGFLISMCLITSLLICLYWLFKPAERFWWKHKYISHAIGFGSFFGCVVIIPVGIHFLLWFFPDGKAGSQARFYIAGAIGIIATLALWDRLYQALEEKLKKDREARIHSDLRWKMRSLCAPLELNQALTEFRRREKELDKLWEEDKLSPFQEEERIVFERLWEKENLRQIIKVLTEARKEHRLNAFGKKLFTELVQKLEELEEVEE